MMEVLGVLFLLLAGLIFIPILLAPSLILIWGVNSIAKIQWPELNNWVRRGALLGVLLALPVALNAHIDRRVDRYVAESQGAIPSGLSGLKVAVERRPARGSRYSACGDDCVRGLISGKIQRYLVVEEHRVNGFNFENRESCPDVDDQIARRLSSKMKNILRERSLQGECLIESPASLSEADIWVKFRNAKKPSIFLSRVEGYDVTVSRKGPDRKWQEIYRDIGFSYGRVFPIFLPALTLDKRGRPVDLIRRFHYRSPAKKTRCKTDILSEYGPCFRYRQRQTISGLLKLNISERELEKTGMISSQRERLNFVSNRVAQIISDGRAPTLNEWAMIEGVISSEYSESEDYTNLVKKVLHYPEFPTPSFGHRMQYFSGEEQFAIGDLVVERIILKHPGPVIGSSSEEQQWYNLYHALNQLPETALAVHYNDLVDTIMKRPNQTRYVTFLKKFGPRSQQTILDIVQTDPRRLRSLAPVMCEMGDQLSGIETSIMEMAKKRKISLTGHYGKLVYFLMARGVPEDQILNVPDKTSPKYESEHRRLKGLIERYNQGQGRC